ncbi:MAG: FHA domain-containing protein, partial [Gemmataceae bacterium]
MADLEAVTILAPTAGDETRQVGRRYPLPLERPVRLGHSAAEADCAIPEDRSISRFHATLRWDGRVLHVEERAAQPPKFPAEPRNRLTHNGMPVRECSLAPGDSFYIGRTRFTLHGESQAEGTVVVPCHEQRRTRTDLEEMSFGHPGDVLRALEKLPDVFRLAASERTLVRQLLKVLLDAVPRAAAAGLVSARPEPSGVGAVAVYETVARVRGSVVPPAPGGVPEPPVADAQGGEFPTIIGQWPLTPDSRPYQFQPSVELVQRATGQQVSVAQHWLPEPDGTTDDPQRL